MIDLRTSPAQKRISVPTDGRIVADKIAMLIQLVNQ